MKKYSIGIDYGTLSARAVLIDLTTGLEAAVSEFVYPHAVMVTRLPDGTLLENNSALQHPADYLDALSHTIGELLEKSGADTNDIVGLGIDFTSCTVLPITQDGTPLCFLEEFKSEPNAYVKLWKHHGANAEAELITALAKENGETWLDSYGGKVSSEWLLPKVLETYNKAPQVYDHTAEFIEAADWLVLLLTGNNVRSSCMAGYKAMWNAKTGYPSPEFLGKINKDFAHIIGDKISENVLPTGVEAGVVTETGARLTGLRPGTAVAVPIIDAHASLPASGIVDAGKLMLIIGTSTCHIVMGDEEKNVSGICGAVQDGIIPGYVAYEAGQSCVGDSFDWFVKNCVPARYEAEAKEQGISTFALLQKKAQQLKVGESGLLALDWWNGNRTPYADYDLTGAIFGLTLQTKPEEIFRALIEATAYGTKAIVDRFVQYNIPITQIYASGGISQKNSLLMQIYADVLGQEIIVPRTSQSGALGSALFASVAGGYFATMKEAADALIHFETVTYKPIPENYEKYCRLYQEYAKLSAYFAEGQNDVLKKLKF